MSGLPKLRLGLMPRIAIIIALALAATSVLDELLAVAVPPPRILFYTQEWLAERTLSAVRVAESVGREERSEALRKLNSDWLVYSAHSERSVELSSTDKPLHAVRQALESALGADKRRVEVFGTPIEDPERETSAITIILPTVPAFIENVLDDSFEEAVIAASRLQIVVQLADGSWLHVTDPSRALAGPRRVRNAVVLGAGLMLIAGFSLLAARMVIRPLRRLAAAADRLGRERELTQIPPSHVPEIDAIAESFNSMQQRLKRFVDERTAMLAAISHDLRTPLTRLRLFAEYVRDPQQRRLVLHDIDEMERMIRASLAFAGDDLRREPHSRVDLAALLISLCDTMADAGQTVRYEGPDHAQFPCRATAIRRAFANLIDNACKYGHEATVTLRDNADSIEVTVCDRGPGIPPELIERALAPFSRLETSRNRESGGVGLGLTIARDVVNEHGGSLSLEPASPTGLCVRVRLPKPQGVAS